MRRRKTRKKSGIRLRLIFFFFILPLAVGIALGSYVAIARGVPSIEELKHYKEIPSTKIYADDDVLIGELKLERGVFMPLEKMPGHLINAVVAVEDSSFWRHSGIDYFAIVRAAMKDILHRQLKEGGSTITQQLAKMTFLTPEKTLKRKLREVALATKIEKNLTKEEILEFYLNRAYFGHGAYGVEMASRVYFGKSVSEITLPESALIAGLLKAPSAYSPLSKPKRARERQVFVLSRMEQEGFITRQQMQEAVQAPTKVHASAKDTAAFNYFIDYIRKYLEQKYGVDMVYKGGLRVYTTLNRKSQIDAQNALQEGLRELDKREGWRGPVDHRDIADIEDEAKEDKKGFRKFMLGLIGKDKTDDELKTVTEIRADMPGARDIVEGTVLSVNKNEAQVDVRGASGRLSINDALWAKNTIVDGKKKVIGKFNLMEILKPGDVIMVGIKSVKGDRVELVLEQYPEVQGAVVAIDPYTGFIRTLVGGYSYTKSEYNRALYAERQAGSAFKPIIYTVALNNGFTPASVVVDEAVSYKGGAAGQWSPKNYDGEYFGPITLRNALAFSRNVISIQLVNAVGIDKVIAFTDDLGLNNVPRDMTIALGSLSITPLELTSCYAVFANGGMKMNPIAIKYITDSKGRVIESNEPKGLSVLSPETAFLITSMMEDVVNYGTGWRAKQLGRPVAGKTGTTNDNRDAWFLGYTPDMVAGVWVGFDDMRSLGSDETGAKAASPIWVSFMRSAFAGGEPRNFDVPEGIVEYSIEDSAGLPLDKTTGEAPEKYFRDTEAQRGH